MGAATLWPSLPSTSERPPPGPAPLAGQPTCGLLTCNRHPTGEAHDPNCYPDLDQALHVTRRGSFDADGFYAALNAERDARKLTWKEVAEESHVSASTLTRMKQGKRPDVDSLAALATWSGLDVDTYVTKGDAEATSMPKIGALLRADPHLSPKSAIAIEKIIQAAYEQMRQDAEG